MIKINKQDLLDNEGKLKNILLLAKNILDNHNLKFIIPTGTCLGAVRNGRVLPWDVNVNIYVLTGDCPLCNKDDSELFFNVFTEFKDNGFNNKTIYGPEWDELWEKRVLYTTGAFLFKSHNPRLELKLISSIDNKSPFFFGELEQVEMYGHLFYVPTPPEKYLESLYGDSWKDIYCPWNEWYHGYNKDVKKGIISEDVKIFTQEVKKWFY